MCCTYVVYARQDGRALHNEDYKYLLNDVKSSTFVTYHCHGDPFVNYHEISRTHGAVMHLTDDDDDIEADCICIILDDCTFT